MPDQPPRQPDPIRRGGTDEQAREDDAKFWTLAGVAWLALVAGTVVLAIGQAILINAGVFP